jgi:arginine deiminase
MNAEDTEHLRILKAALAEEIRDVRRLIEQIAEVIVSDEQFALANMEQLQAFDLAIQRADESADMLERLSSGSCVHSAVEAVRLSDVQDRFRAALKAAA